MGAAARWAALLDCKGESTAARVAKKLKLGSGADMVVNVVPHERVM